MVWGCKKDLSFAFEIAGVFRGPYRSLKGAVTARSSGGLASSLSRSDK